MRPYLRFRFLVGLLLISLISGCMGGNIPPVPAGKCKWAGVRASTYGIDNFYPELDPPFPSPQVWAIAINHMASHWAGSTRMAIWLVGEVDFSTTGTTLQFKAPKGVTYDPLIEFDPSVADHESCLSFFDIYGIKVFLQLEPGFASVTDQIDAVLRTFAHHPCVAGLAIDVEWYKCASSGETLAYLDNDNDVTGTSIAAKWEKQVQSYNSNYRLLLKHYKSKCLPQTYRGQIIFCCDDERNGTEKVFLAEHRQMAEFCYPNPIIYQIGYPSDQAWWSKYSDAPKALGDALISQTPNDQACGVLWVDFSFTTLPH
jgi:hypothetical protein